MDACTDLAVFVVHAAIVYAAAPFPGVVVNCPDVVVLVFLLLPRNLIPCRCENVK